MQFCIVASEDHAPLARRLSHGISKMPEHSAFYWSEKQYKDNELKISKNVRLIFAGENEFSKSYATILPEKFSAYGTSCYWEDNKALLLAKVPTIVTKNEIESLGRIAKAKRDEILTASEGSKSKILELFYDLPWHLMINLVMAAGYIFWNNLKRRKAYNEIQFDYLITRFIGEEFSLFVMEPEIK